jgi:hypothetical protein
MPNTSVMMPQWSVPAARRKSLVSPIKTMRIGSRRKT